MAAERDCWQALMRVWQPVRPGTGMVVAAHACCCYKPGQCGMYLNSMQRLRNCCRGHRVTLWSSPRRCAMLVAAGGRLWVVWPPTTWPAPCQIAVDETCAWLPGWGEVVLRLGADFNVWHGLDDTQCCPMPTCSRPLLMSFMMVSVRGLRVVAIVLAYGIDPVMGACSSSST